LTTFTGLARQLPLQNALLALVGTALVALSAQLILCSSLFLPRNPASLSAGRFSGFTAWSITPWWFVAVVSSRITAGFISHSLPPGFPLGFRRIGIGTGLIVLFALGSIIFAINTVNVRVNPAPIHVPLHSVFLFAFVAGSFFGFVTLLLLTPVLINKMPTREKVERDWLLLWLLPGLLCLTTMVAKLNWIGTAAVALVQVAVTLLALRGAKSAEEPRVPAIA
jgi:hypothetical protein